MILSLKYLPMITSISLNFCYNISNSDYFVLVDEDRSLFVPLIHKKQRILIAFPITSVKMAGFFI